MLIGLTKYNRLGSQCREELQFKVFEAKVPYLPNRSSGITESITVNLHDGIDTIFAARGLPEPSRSVLDVRVWTEHKIYARLINDRAQGLEPSQLRQLAAVVMCT